jgi:hypothetical protein
MVFLPNRKADAAGGRPACYRYSVHRYVAFASFTVGVTVIAVTAFATLAVCLSYPTRTPGSGSRAECQSGQGRIARSGSCHNYCLCYSSNCPAPLRPPLMVLLPTARVMLRRPSRCYRCSVHRYVAVDSFTVGVTVMEVTALRRRPCSLSFGREGRGQRPAAECQSGQVASLEAALVTLSYKYSSNCPAPLRPPLWCCCPQPG